MTFGRPPIALSKYECFEVKALVYMSDGGYLILGKDCKANGESARHHKYPSRHLNTTNLTTQPNPTDLNVRSNTAEYICNINCVVSISISQRRGHLMAPCESRQEHRISALTVKLKLKARIGVKRSPSRVECPSDYTWENDHLADGRRKFWWNEKPKWNLLYERITPGSTAQFYAIN